MGSIGDPFLQPVPTVGTPGPGYATQINAVLAEAVTRLSAKVPFGAVNFGNDVTLNGQNILNAGYITLNNTAATPVASPVNRLTAFGGDFWWVGPSGPVQVTTGTTLNAAALGGITGDYGGASPAQFRYDSPSTRYTAYASFAGNTLAYIRALGFDVAGSGTASARLLFAGSTSRSYTLPVAPATSTDRPLYMDTAGNITLGHGSKAYSYSAIGAVQTNGTTFSAQNYSSTGGLLYSGNASKGLDGMLVGFRFSAVQFQVSGFSSLTASVYRVDSSGTLTQIGTAAQVTGGYTIMTVTLGTAETVAVGCNYFVFLNSGSAITWFGYHVVGTLPN